MQYLYLNKNTKKLKQKKQNIKLLIKCELYHTENQLKRKQINISKKVSVYL